ncbi:MAG: PD-(D/E)XK nuclease family protein [Gemmatimonadales bacterium]|nr:PD-(D/E)XK nuclease family protein [Gemmatimonadales bacterium]
MTVSTLLDIEACPRRWALSSADYPDLWSGRGYPARVHIGAVRGSVAHLVVETVMRDLVQAGCSSAQDGAAVQVMKARGGYTRVVSECIDRVLGRFKGNPRARPQLEAAERSMRALIPELRAQAQAFFARIRLETAPTRYRESGAAGRQALPVGAHPEVELMAPTIGWKGRADLVVLTGKGCEIIDFKTGAEAESHEFQVQVYALLWSLDGDLNPDGRPPSKLTLAYPGKDRQVEVPSAARLQELRHQLLERGDAARTAVRSLPPEVHPAAATCRYCSVRHLCSEYWTSEVQELLTTPHEPQEETSPRDLEVELQGQHGTASWDGIIEAGFQSGPGRRVLLRGAHEQFGAGAGRRFRLLDAFVLPVRDNDTGPVVATMTGLSEAFEVT